MTRFHYTPDLHDIITKALGDGWTYDARSEDQWDLTIEASRFSPLDSPDVFCTQSEYDGKTIKIFAYLYEDYYTLDDLIKIQDLIPIIRQAEDRLRAAGLVEVDE